MAWYAYGRSVLIPPTRQHMASPPTEAEQMLTEAERRFIEAEKVRAEEEEKTIESMATRLLSDLEREIERTGKRKIQFPWQEYARNES